MPRYLFRQQNLTNHQVIHRLEHHPSQAPPNAVAGAPSNTTMGTSATSNTWVQNGFTFSYDGYAASHITGPTSTNGGTTPSLSKTSVAGTAASNRPRYMPPIAPSVRVLTRRVTSDQPGPRLGTARPRRQPSRAQYHRWLPSSTRSRLLTCVRLTILVAPSARRLQCRRAPSAPSRRPPPSLTTQSRMMTRRPPPP